MGKRINIPSVTGNVVITVTATAIPITYTITKIKTKTKYMIRIYLRLFQSLMSLTDHLILTWGKC